MAKRFRKLWHSDTQISRRNLKPKKQSATAQAVKTHELVNSMFGDVLTAALYAENALLGSMNGLSDFLNNFSGEGVRFDKDEDGDWVPRWNESMCSQDCPREDHKDKHAAPKDGITMKWDALRKMMVDEERQILWGPSSPPQTESMQKVLGITVP